MVKSPLLFTPAFATGLLISLFGVVNLAIAEPSGYAGRTATTSAGCGSCHGSSASSATTVSLQPGTNTTVAPGSITQFTIVVAHPTQRVAGVGIAVRTTATGSTAAGTLAAINGQMTRLRQGEITHSAPKSMQGGQASFTFQWTAPSQEGIYYLQAIGNACNGNGGEDAGDLWAFMQPVEITVTTATTVHENGSSPTMIVAPNPVLNGISPELLQLPAGAIMAQIVAPNGSMVYQQRLSGATASLPLQLPHLPSGTYAVLVHTRTGLVRTRMTILQ